MAGFNHTKIVTWKRDAGTFVSTTNVYNGPAEFSIDESIPADTEDFEIAAVVTVANVICMIIESDKDVTLKTNDADTPDDEFDVVSKKEIMWTNDDAVVNPLGTDLTALFISNADPDNAARFKATFLLDQSPAS